MWLEVGGERRDWEQGLEEVINKHHIKSLAQKCIDFLKVLFNKFFPGLLVNLPLSLSLSPLKGDE